MVHKHCDFGTCRSDSRYGYTPQMKDVHFIAFPKEKSKLERWVRAYSREGFTADHVTKHTFICSCHFVGGKGPTTDHPDPIPGNFCDAQVR